ncbi:rhodanese domain protein / beta-lactamase domain protein (plasmid) [Natrialba magadii ATCC 43099]|uniref:Beta-lactamase n=1 Tax=Natrialba magadii (strain ATCC 43099 / DSM 3394 / CCM 3739 / CIP 104546 / IAM 13178 / JCM 8861 / NBRC 102185 / NCIMB 2190 / MS3) TaxID=547559 RepID=D3T0S1_NATMM|nr:MBL fold metallo-hydrolase [Natrialba magadii]ADD07180.1 rhodanese domain protein / beta-lactamase domain protein [Natrialba magadii ATCC 43099]ELY34584.1 beta-lactamase [Natrialba magadii ATCC 43099]
MSNTTIDPIDVSRRLQHDESADLFVLDVRSESEYDEWQIGESMNIPIYDELLEYDYSTLESHIDELPAETEIAVMCIAGVTSARAAEFLRTHGFDAKSVADGMNGWGRVHRQYEVESVDGVVQIVRPGTGCVSYLVHDDGEAVVVDPSQYIDEYLHVADERELEIVGIADTHAHADHVSGARQLAGELDVPYYLHEDDAGELGRVTELVDGESIAVGGRDLDVIYTPGHTPGSVSFEFGDALLSGDTLFLRSVGRPDLEDSAEDAVRTAASQLFDSLERVTELDDERVVLPGHFSDESIRPLATDLGELQAETTNELLSYVEAGDEDAFVETIVDSLADEPANYNEIKQINWGKEQPGGDVEELELGPNNCAAN